MIAIVVVVIFFCCSCILAYRTDRLSFSTLSIGSSSVFLVREAFRAAPNFPLPKEKSKSISSDFCVQPCVVFGWLFFSVIRVLFCTVICRISSQFFQSTVHIVVFCANCHRKSRITANFRINNFTREQNISAENSAHTKKKNIEKYMRKYGRQMCENVWPRCILYLINLPYRLEKEW